MQHKERAHSSFSASGAERWLSCPGSVKLSENLPTKDSVWSLEGTRAHEVLEEILTTANRFGLDQIEKVNFKTTPPFEMVTYGIMATNFILELKHHLGPETELLVETKIHLGFIHPEMFGTFDAALVDLFGTLHVFDYKYGAGHAVSPVENLQMIFYGVGLAHQYGWNFKRVRLWIIQPRVRGYDGPLFWDLPVMDLKQYVGVFEKGVKAVLTEPPSFKEGSHCHWCRAKGICPLKTQGKFEKALSIFQANPL